ncbi:MAG: hypothetical protein HC798_02315 [Polaribacter sp.]|nr:hypothetical protein [Polaribacter sp.]
MIIIKIIGITYFFDDELAAKYSYFEEVFSLITSISIFFYAFHILSKKENLFVKILSFDDLKWIYTFFKLGLFSYVFWIVALSITIALNFSSYIYAYYPLRIFTTILIYWIGFQSIKQIRILNERQILRKLNSTLQTQKNEVFEISKPNKNTEFDNIKQQIFEKQFFTESKLTVDQLADMLSH